MARPRLTVAMPVYNGGATIIQALASIDRQTYRDFKVVIADNGSTDDTATIVAQWACGKNNVSVIRRGETLSPYMNFASLARSADTELFVWLADDDIWEPEFLRACIESLDSNNAAHCAFTHYRQYFHFDGSLGEVVKHLPSTTWDKALRLTIRFADPAPCSFYGVMRTDILKWLLEFAGELNFDFSDVFFSLAMANGGMLEIVPRDLFRSGVRRPAEVERQSVNGGRLRYGPYLRKGTRLIFHALPRGDALIVAANFWLRTYRLYHHNRRARTSSPQSRSIE